MPDINMLDVAKKLLPDVEENMPEAVRSAFDEGRIKSIFRTGTPTVNAESGKRFAKGTSAKPSSHYFLLDDGRLARYGYDDTGSGWMGARASVPDIILNQDDPFVFNKILFDNNDVEDLTPR